VRALLPAVVVVSAFVMPPVPPVARAAPPVTSCAVAASCARPVLGWHVAGVRRISAACLSGHDRCVRGIVARTVVFPVLGVRTPGERGGPAVG
jgi:hypothetical protein